MPDAVSVALLIGTAIVIFLQIVFLVRKPKVPAEVLVRIEGLEQTTQALHVAVGKLEGALQGTANAQVEQLRGLVDQMRCFTVTAGEGLERVRGAVDQKLSQVIEDAGRGRQELSAALQRFDISLGGRFDGFGQLLGSRLDVASAQMRGLAETTEQKLEAIRTSLESRFEALTASNAEALNAARIAVEQILSESASGRKELGDSLVAFRTELTAALRAVTEDAGRTREAVAAESAAFRTQVQERFDVLSASNREQLTAVSHALKEQLDSMGQLLRDRLGVMGAEIGQRLTELTQGNEQKAELLRSALNERLAAIQADNTAKLDEMRRTVDEKLHATLEQRLGESFKLVSERLEQVHRGLGEMQSLAAGVGDLKRVLTNVKTRGVWGEVQLASLLEQILSPEQYGTNVATRPRNSERVEFAIRLPGNEDGVPVWLPIDAKFPVEDYQRLLDAQDRADAVAAEAAAKAIETRLRDAARTIREKYVEPPYTTDFAVLYLPIEGLYAEALRRPGLAEALQRDFRITLSGPTTLAAMLNSLQMGFRTLAIEKRSSEVWAVLSAVKTEFAKFGDALAHTKRKLEEATNSIGKAEARTRALSRKLREVEALPEGQAVALLGGEKPIQEEEMAAEDS